jgi:hypothetical protein
LIRIKILKCGVDGTIMDVLSMWSELYQQRQKTVMANGIISHCQVTQCDPSKDPERENK